MGFQKGHPGGPGRPKGSTGPKMKTLRRSLAEAGFDLGNELKLLLKNPEASIDHQIAILKLIAQYTQSVPKEDDDGDVEAKPDLKAVSSDKLAEGLKG